MLPAWPKADQRTVGLVLGFVGSVGSTTISFIVRVATVRKLHTIPDASHSYPAFSTRCCTATSAATASCGPHSCLPWCARLIVAFLRRGSPVCSQYGIIVLALCLSANIVKLVQAGTPDARADRIAALVEGGR